MKIKRYFGEDIRRAIRQVRDELGPDAVILSNQRVKHGVEIVAAIDYDESLNSTFTGSRERIDESPSPEAYAGASLEDTGKHELHAREKITKNIWTQDPVIQEMRDEIKDLKSLFKNQLSGLAWQELGRANPVNRELLEKLNALGFSDNLCQMVSRKHFNLTDSEVCWRHALASIADMIRAPERDLMTQGGVYALVGPTGAGKTTTAAKIAARYAMENGSNRVLLVTIDNFRVAAYEQLTIYGRIMGIPVVQIENSKDLQFVIGDHYDKELILIDTAGMGQYDQKLSEQVEILDLDGINIRKTLVLPANMQYTGLKDVIRAFGKFNPEETIITKLDECISLGSVISAVIEDELSVRYICDGQEVPEDIHRADPHRLVSRCVALNNKYRRKDQEMMALNLGRAVVDAHY